MTQSVQYPQPAPFSQPRWSSLPQGSQEPFPSDCGVFATGTATISKPPTALNPVNCLASASSCSEKQSSTNEDDQPDEQQKDKRRVFAYNYEQMKLRQHYSIRRNSHS